MPNRNITPMLRTAARRIGLGLAIAAALFVAAVVATARSGDRTLWPPKPGTATTEVFVVNHGYHAGIVVPLAALADAASRRELRALGYSRPALPISTASRSAGATKASTARSRRPHR